MELDNGRQISEDEKRWLEQDIIRMEYDLNEQYCELGKGIVEKVEQEAKKINGLVDQIIEQRQKLAKAEREKSCSECAESNDSNNSCCKRCGMKLPKDNEIKEDNNGTE